MVTPLVSVDADYSGQPIDAPYHHRSQYFEDRYSQFANQKVSTFNFAIPGEMPSDAYFITRFLLKGEKRPDVIVYGVGPRDFLDNLLPSASATDPFEHLAKFGDVWDHAPHLVCDWEQQLNHLLAQALYLYDHKADLSSSLDRIASAALVSRLPKETPQQEYEYRQMIMPELNHFEAIAKECMIAPTKPEANQGQKDNIEEYRQRYHDLKWDTFLSQMQFLGETLDLAKQRDIHAVIVAMPITERNRRLISDSVWRLYKENLKVIAQTKGAEFVDMQPTGQFSDPDFADTVHLNAHGGMVLLDTLALRLSRDTATKSSLLPHPIREEDLHPNPSMLAGLKKGKVL
jgi:hypothetical protein